MSERLSQDVPARDLGLQGCYAGSVTRFAAFTIDAIAVLTLFTVAARVGEYTMSALLGIHVQLSNVPIFANLLLATWWVLYCAYPLAQSGRTLGMTVVGVRVVRIDGRDIGARRAALRVFAFPLSFALLNLGFVLILLRRDRRALHDLISGSAVVYAWDARAARLRFLAKHGTEEDIARAAKSVTASTAR